MLLPSPLAKPPILRAGRSVAALSRGLWQATAVRAACWADVDELAELAQETTEDWPRPALERELRRDGARVLVACTDAGQLAGACIAWHFEEELQLLDLFVGLAHRRQGHAKDLLSVLLDRCALYAVCSAYSPPHF